MANKFFSGKVVQRIDVDFAATPITANSNITVATLPANCFITDGWAFIKTELGDADAGDNTTLSIGYTGVAAGFYPATSIADMDAAVVLKLIPGVLEIKAGEAITTVDTAVEVVALARNSGATHNGIALTATKNVILSASNDQNINAGTMSIFLEYFKF